MTLVEVTKPTSRFIVAIMLDKAANKFRFVNITKNYIDEYRFDSEKDAIDNINKCIKDDEITLCQIIPTEQALAFN